MNKLASLLVVLACVGCSKKNSADKASAAKPVDDGKTCPMPGANQIYSPRFAVGSTPDYALPDMASDHGHICHEDFTPSDVLKIQDGKPVIVAAGTFTGTCKESPGPRTYTAVKPAKLGIDVDAMQTNEGKLGMNEPVFLDSTTPDKHAGVRVAPLDRCGDTLDTGASPQTVKWSPGPDCDKVVKVTPYSEMSAPSPTATAMQLSPVAAGTCTISAEWLGVKGDVKVTVK